jgi:hypothetical protein
MTKRIKKLKSGRALSFEEIAAELQAGRILDIKANPSRPNQKVFILFIRGFLCRPIKRPN